MAGMLEDSRTGLRTIAVTGTNGKTTTTTMIASVVAASGEPRALVTTLGMWVGNALTASDKSMGAFDATLSRAAEAGVRTLALEVTSKALAEGFATRHPADIAVFTNLSHDHLDRHGSPEAYLAAKAQLFVHLKPGGVAVLNAEEQAAQLLAEVLPGGTRVAWYSLSSEGARDVDLGVRRVDEDAQSLLLHLRPSPLADALGGQLRVGVGGRFNADNALAAALSCAMAGYEPAAIADGLAHFSGVPGRFEQVWNSPLVLVDFAHSPDALERLLGSARSLAMARGGQLIALFGCGGDRDRKKRPAMGAVAERLCDQVYVTSDNPRSEDPNVILAAILGGMERPLAARVIEDRHDAIATCVLAAAPNDVVVLSGRGPETQQWLADGPRPSSDREVALRAAQRRPR